MSNRRTKNEEYIEYDTRFVPAFPNLTSSGRAIPPAPVSRLGPVTVKRSAIGVYNIANRAEGTYDLMGSTSQGANENDAIADAKTDATNNSSGKANTKKIGIVIISFALVLVVVGIGVGVGTMQKEIHNNKVQNGMPIHASHCNYCIHS